MPTSISASKEPFLYQGTLKTRFSLQWPLVVDIIAITRHKTLAPRESNELYPSLSASRVYIVAHLLLLLGHTCVYTKHAHITVCNPSLPDSMHAVIHERGRRTHTPAMSSSCLYSGPYCIYSPPPPPPRPIVLASAAFLSHTCVHASY